MLGFATFQGHRKLVVVVHYDMMLVFRDKKSHAHKNVEFSQE